MNFLKNITSSILDDQENFTDLTQVAAIDGDACLDVLQRRFAIDQIYTHCGPLLVAINPYRMIDGLYSTDVLEKHLVLMPSEKPDPHVFGMAARAYQQMMASGSNQAVVISGESGAGKTETAKFLLNFLARAAAGNSAAGAEDERSSLQRRVMGTNPIMESFGCAQTVRNDNSSRFGKLVLLQFTKTGRLSAASMQTYLLEKSRVVHQASNEANFHAFYEALAGSRDEERAQLGLGDASVGYEDFTYADTEAARVRDTDRDASLYARTLEAMSAVGLSATERLGALRVLYAILHMGNIGFGDGDTAEIEPETEEALSDAARLLGCAPEHLGSGMCTRRLKAGADWVTTGNSVSQASEVRHALSKQLYSFLFTWLVARINSSLAYRDEGAAYGPGPHIAYVDIFGFEVFAVNSLEQLCINFANEKLQRLFVGVLFESVQAMYDAEGIETDRITFSDNKQVVDLIGGAPQGLLAMLTEECVFPKGSDTTYLQKVNTAFKRHEVFKEVKTSANEFTITHFAGDVTYAVDAFLEKNKDPISQDLQVLVEYSEEPFIADVVKTALGVARRDAEAAAAAEPAKKGSKMRSGKFVGVVDAFKTSLKSLISTLQAGELHFIRCLKSNDRKQPEDWDRDVASRQLLSAGIVSAVAATRSGFSDHLPPTYIIQAFGPLCPDLETEGASDMVTAEQVLQACGVAPEQYAAGKTKLFLRQGVLGELQRLRMEHIGGYASFVQAAIRGMLARSLLRKLKEEAARKAEERRRREEELRRQRAEAERRRLEAQRQEEERIRKQEEAEAERRKQVQMARAFSFDRKRRKKKEEEELKAKQQEEEKAAKRKAAEAKRKEADDRMRAQLEASGVKLGISERDPGAGIDDEADLADLARRTEAAVARAEAEAAAAYASSRFELSMPDSPPGSSAGMPPKPSGGGGGGSGFQLQLPSSSPAKAPPAAPNVGRLVEQRKLDELAAQFVCPLEDVLAYAEMVGMDVHEDTDLLWIADEALQAPEPVGWEQRQDPRGNTYYLNNTTNMTMQQHPVDYHYQQLYLQFKMQRQQQQAMALLSPRSRQFAAESEAQSSAREGGFKLDLRSVNADGGSGDDAALPTPKGWLKRSANLLTPRSTARKEEAKRELVASLESHRCAEIEIVILRRREPSGGWERLGMELNAYNQILSFVPGGPTDRSPDIHLYDRIVAVDNVNLGSKMLTDVLEPRDEQQFVVERWYNPASRSAQTELAREVLLALGKARANGKTVDAAMRDAAAEGAAALAKKKSTKKWRGGAGEGPSTPTLSRFTVTIQRGETGLGLVLDEENVVMDMVPGSPVDLQREQETKGDPRLQVGDKIMTVDGREVSIDEPLDQVIDIQEWHTLSVERLIEPTKRASPPPSPMSPRGMLKAITPRGSKKKDDEDKKAPTGAERQPSRALREVRIYKEHEDERLGIRFVRDDEGFDRQLWGRDDMVTPIVAALDPKGEAARAGMEIDDMVLSINGQTGLSNTEAAAMLRDLAGQIVLVVRKCTWLGVGHVGSAEDTEPSMPTPETPRSAMRRLV